MNRRRFGRRVMLALVMGIVFWVFFATQLFPNAIESAYYDTAFTPLHVIMDDRDLNHLDYYLGTWHDVARRVLQLAAGVLVLAALWFRRNATLDDHWFAPASLHDLAIARFVVVGTQLALFLYPSIPLACEACNLGYQMMLSETNPDFYQPGAVLRVWLAPLGGGERPAPSFFQTVWILGVVSGISAFVGLGGRLGVLGIACASTLLTAHAYSYVEYRHSEALMTIALWTLALSPCNAVYSLDAIRARRRRNSGTGARGDGSAPEQRSFARWPLRLTQWMLALTYFDSAMWKLSTGGIHWFESSTLRYYAARGGVTRETLLGLWFSEQSSLISPSAFLLFGFELLFPLVLVVPRITALFVLAGMCFHLVTYFTVGPLFLQHMALYVVFIEPVRENLRGGAAWMRSLLHGVHSA